MGSLTSKPKAPATVTKVVYMPSSASSSSSTESAEPNPAEVAKTRAENVLRRNRGVWGNVLTGFRGILSSSDSAPQRKILLGE